MRKEYAYDKENMRFRKVTTSAWKVVRRFLLFLLVTDRKSTRLNSSHD